MLELQTSPWLYIYFIEIIKRMSYNPYYPMDSPLNLNLGYTPGLSSIGSYSSSSILPLSTSSSLPIDSYLSQDPLLRTNTFREDDRSGYKASRSGERFDITTSKADGMFYGGTDRLKSFTPTASLSAGLSSDYKRSYQFEETLKNRRSQFDQPSTRNMYASQMIGTSSSGSKFSGGLLESMGRNVSNELGADTGYKGSSLNSMARPVEMPYTYDRKPLPSYNPPMPSSTMPTLGGLEFKTKSLSDFNNDLRSTSYSDSIDICVTPPQPELVQSSSEPKRPSFSFKPSFAPKNQADKPTLGKNLVAPGLQGPPANAPNLQGPSLAFTNADGTRPSNNNRFKKKIVFSKDNPQNGKAVDVSELPQQQSRSETLIPQSSSPLKGKGQSKPVCKDDFVVGKKLGKGKFGLVHLVKHKVTGMVFAMKVIEKAMMKDEKLQNQFLRELKIQCYLNHPNITKMYGYFDDPENLYLILELCCDGMLFTVIKERRRLPELQAKQMIRHFCSGCEYLHRQRVIHRDLKLENIIVHEGVAKLCDFGWAVYSTDQFRTTVCGTPVYKPPEQIMGEKYDEKCDIWAIGILSYEVMVGKLPFKINTERDLQKICNEDISFPEYVELSENAKNFVLNILKKNPEDRCDMDEIMNHPFLKMGKDELKFDIEEFL